MTKQRFKDQFYELMAEFTADEEGMVQIEGIDMMTEYLTVLKRNVIEKDFLPNLEKMLTKAADPVNDDEIRIRMAKISGKILHRLSHF